MRDTCTNCNAELTENLECAQCGFVATVPSVNEPELNEEPSAVAPEPLLDDEQELLDPEPNYEPLGEFTDEDPETSDEGHRITIVNSPLTVLAETEEKSLIEFTQPLPTRVKYKSPPQFSTQELQVEAEQLKAEHLVLVNCPDVEIAFAAGYQLIDVLNLSGPVEKLLLNFERISTNGAQPSIYNLIKEHDPDKHFIVLADATTEKGKQFLQPILSAGPGASADIRNDLEQNHIYLICLINLSSSDEWLHRDDGPRRLHIDLKFRYWPLPFLRRLLVLNNVPNAGNVEIQLDKQRKQGWWNPNDSEFYWEVRNLISQGQLEVQIEKWEKQPPIKDVGELFKGNDPLPDTVLYVASFFANLTPYEFNQLVAKLLHTKHVTNNSKLNGDSQPANDSELKRWHAVPDQILESCKLVTTPTRDVAAGVHFMNHMLRDNLRDYLNYKYRFFLENKFQQLEELGLIFDRSPRLSQSAIKLSVEMANSYPEYYGSEWLASFVVDFEAFFASVGTEEPKAWRFINEINPAQARKRFYQTIAALLREMLQQPRMDEVISGFFDELLFLKQDGSILEIVRRLQFEPAFDQFRWLKQLFHRSAQPIREQAYEYLRNYLKRTGVRVCQALASLELWLPNSDRPLDVPAKYALRLIHSYFDQTDMSFDKRYYGAWPSACPLFAFKDCSDASERLALLVRLVLHPSVNRLNPKLNPAAVQLRIKRLITNWFYILRGPIGKDSLLREAHLNDLDKPLDGATVCELLLRTIKQVASEAQQASLLDHWREENRLLLRRMGLLSFGSKAWHELAWKRELLGELIKSYEQLPHNTMVLQAEQ